MSLGGPLGPNWSSSTARSTAPRGLKKVDWGDPESLGGQLGPRPCALGPWAPNAKPGVVINRMVDCSMGTEKRKRILLRWGG